MTIVTTVLFKIRFSLYMLILSINRLICELKHKKEAIRLFIIEILYVPRFELI